MNMCVWEFAWIYVSNTLGLLGNVISIFNFLKNDAVDWLQHFTSPPIILVLISSYYLQYLLVSVLLLTILMVFSRGIFSVAILSGILF